MSGDELDRVFLVSRRDVLDGRFPDAEAVVLIDAELVHRYPEARLLELLHAPSEDAPTGPIEQLAAVFAIDARELEFFPHARRAAIILDHRGVPADHLANESPRTGLSQTA
jgi:hypothetical protein